MKKTSLILSLAIILVTACSKSNEVARSGNTGGNTSGCDTTNMTYSADIEPIIKANCYSCHADGNSEGGISLDSYEKLKQPAGNGILTGVITHANGFPSMPEGGPQLSECDINKIKAWIANGILNN
jgi:uncharacterized membrane protein